MKQGSSDARDKPVLFVEVKKVRIFLTIGGEKRRY